MSGRHEAVERRDLVKRDLDELADQIRHGEIDPEVGDRLATAYRSELEKIDAAIAQLPPPSELPVEQRPSGDGSGVAPRSTRRVFIGAGLLIAAMSIAIFTVGGDAEPAAQTTPGGLTVDPATVSDEELEAVVAANPDITAMRMALADRYFESEDYSAALSHYLYIAENTEDRFAESRALARVGWMAYVTNQGQAASEYIEASLRSDPSNSEAILFRGFVTLYGLNDAVAALPQLEAALELDNLSDGVIQQVEEAIAEAQGSGSDD